MASPLRDFNRRSVDDLIEQGITMVYDRYHTVTKGENWGMWIPWNDKIYISPVIKNTKSEDLTIVHEWIHAYEDRILLKEFREAQVEWWAHYHLRRDEWLAYYIRTFFPEFRRK